MTVPLAALRERIPEVDGGRVAHVDQGWDFDVYVVDDEWVVRVPRRPEVARRAPAEIALLAVLAPSLPVAVPRFEAAGANGAAWAAYRRIDGKPLVSDPQATDVAAFLSALHAFPIESAVGAGVPAGDWRTAMAEELAEFERRVLPLLDPPERRAAERAFRRYADDEASFAFRPAVIHADLGPEHLLWTSDGRLRGVIDWTDAEVGDPALDFAWLLHGLGDRFAEQLLAAYDGPVDATFRERAAFYHLLGPWHEVTYGQDLDLPAYVESGLAGVRERLR